MKSGRNSQLLLVIRGWLIIAGLLLLFHGGLLDDQPAKPQVQRQKDLTTYWNY
jgi:hypothetical protein